MPASATALLMILFTAVMNERDEYLLWYIDMIAEQGIDKDGVPYFDDLYLDLVIYPDGTIVVDDMNELEDALVNKSITQTQFNLAITTCDNLKNGLLYHMISLIEFTKKCFEMVCD